MNAREIDFAYKVRHALNEQSDNLPPATLEQLAQARKNALARKKADTPVRAVMREVRFAGGAGSLLGDRFSWLSRMGMVIPMIIAAAGIFTIYKAESQQRINDVAEIDAMVLADELPLTAYLDKGFNAYLAKRAE